MSAEIVSGGGGRRKKPDASERPLSELLAQGWELGQWQAAAGTSGMIEYGFHLRRGAENKLLLIRRKVMGEGLHAEEFDV